MVCCDPDGDAYTLAMIVTMPIPDDFAARFGSAAELGRRALEALVLEEYRAGRITMADLQDVLRVQAGPALDGFLKARGIEVEGMDRKAAAEDVVARFKAFSKGKTLSGLDVSGLISEGRR